MKLGWNLFDCSNSIKSVAQVFTKNNVAMSSDYIFLAMKTHYSMERKLNTDSGLTSDDETAELNDN